MEQNWIPHAQEAKEEERTEVSQPFEGMFPMT
jgi:hypothetical protein